MSTTKTDTQRDSSDAESIDTFFTFADDDTAQPTPQPKPGPSVATKPTRNNVASIAFQPRAKTYSAYRATTPDEPSDWWNTSLRCISVLCFIVGIGMFVKPYFNSPKTTHTAFKPVAASSSQPRVTTRNIEDCELGQRALGKNPLRDQVETLPEPDPETSRKIVVRMDKPSGHRLDIELIRSLAWIKSVGAIEHESFHLSMEEVGAVGDAYVESILPCPPIEKGDGNVITGIFAHEADPDTRILSVTFSDGTFLKGVTDNHPFWSVDRNDYIAIGDIKEGDWVKTASGLIQIVKLDSRFARSGEMLYNLETHNEHVFQVALAGILVHNSCVIHGNPQYTSAAHAKSMQDMAQRMADSGAYTDVFMHSKWLTILEGKGVSVSPNRLPDVAGVRLDGKIDLIEFASSKNDFLRGKLLERNRDIWNQLPANMRGDILVYDELGNWAKVFPE